MHHWQQKFHTAPPKGLLNDPNGLIFWKGEYHIFYQWNPLECTHGAKSWAHLKTVDFFQWESLPIALEPGEYYDINGCYSGSAVEFEDDLYLIYTGNVKIDGERKSYQCLARSSDGINFEKLGPVIYDRDIPKGYTRHFRDPKVFKKGDIFHMVLGAQRENLTGTILLYTSSDLKDWAFQGEILDDNFGYMCECPDYIEDENRGALILSPQGIEPQGDLYNNLYQSGYILNPLSKREFRRDNFIELDRGFEFYAPQTFDGTGNRNILIGWMGMPEELSHPTVTKEGWIHCLTVPRQLTFKEDKLFQTPIKELEVLRKSSIHLENIQFKDFLNLKEYGILGKCYEFILEVENIQDDFTVNLRCGENEKTVFTLDFGGSKMIFDRNHSGLGYKGVRRTKISRNNDLKLHFFVDSCSVELFINDGEEVFTGNIYPSEGSEEILLSSQKEIKIKKLDFYLL